MRLLKESVMQRVNGKQPLRSGVRRRGRSSGLRSNAAKLSSQAVPKETRNAVFDALEKRGRRATAGDIAGDAGIEVSEASDTLNALAEDTEADLAVSENGDVLYVFPRDARGKLSRKSFAIRVEPAIDRVKSIMLYLVRASFGAALVASVLVVYTTIIAILSSSSRDERDDDRRPSPTTSFAIIRPFPSDFFLFFDPFYSPYVCRCFHHDLLL